MNVTRVSDSPTEVTLNVAMNSEDEEPFISRSYRRLVNRVQIPGFRRGKAPRSIVESHLSRAALVQEALEFMIPETLDRILKDQNLRAFGEPDLEILEVDPVAFKAVVPLEPVVELGNFRSIRLERKPAEVTADQVSEVIERLRYEAAPWEPVDRAVQFGDLLSLNVWGAIAGEQAIDDQGIDYIPQLDNPNPIPGFSVYLEGMSEGQEKEFNLTVPQGQPQHPYAGKECHLRVQVLSVKEKKLPELDDEFAKGIRDGYESLGALRSYVSQRLTEAAEDASLRQLEQESLQELLKGATLQVSQLIYQRELDTLYENRQRALSNQRLDLDTYLSVIGKSQEEWLAQLRPQAEERLNTFLVLRKIAEEEGFNVSHEEIQGEMDSILSAAGDSRESVQRTLSTENAQDSIRTSLLNRKVMGRLVEIVQGHAGQGEPQAGATGASAGEVDAHQSQEGHAEASLPHPEGTNEGAQSHAV